MEWRYKPDAAGGGAPAGARRGGRLRRPALSPDPPLNENASMTRFTRAARVTRSGGPQAAIRERRRHRPPAQESGASTVACSPHWGQMGHAPNPTESPGTSAESGALVDRAGLVGTCVLELAVERGRDLAAGRPARPLSFIGTCQQGHATMRVRTHNRWGYKRGCRCDVCRTDWTAYARDRAAAGIVRVRTHNRWGYGNGCRCDVCRADHAAYARERYSRERAAA